MFHNLRLKLTLLNVGVVSVICLFFVAGIYFQMVRGVSRQSDQLMQVIATEAGSASGQAQSLRERHRLNAFFVKVDESGKITESSQDQPVNPEELRSLVAKALQNPGDRGRIELGGHGRDFRFQKATLKNGTGSVLVFLNTEAEDGVVEHLMAALVFTGLGGIALTLFGSFIMANRALVPISASWERQKHFVADASHELRTPITVINTTLDIIRDNQEQTVASQLDWLQNIQAETDMMAKLVEDLLLLARADSNQQMLNREHFDLSAAGSITLNALEVVAAQKSIRLVNGLGKGIKCYGDVQRLKQLITILVDNGIKYTPSGGQVGLDIKRVGNNVELSVWDTGEGIDHSHLPHIFERFYRVDTSRSQETGGTGLGLSIAEWIVKEHGGSIRVESSPGKGSRFRVNLPC